MSLALNIILGADAATVSALIYFQVRLFQMKRRLKKLNRDRAAITRAIRALEDGVAPPGGWPQVVATPGGGWRVQRWVPSEWAARVAAIFNAQGFAAQQAQQAREQQAQELQARLQIEGIWEVNQYVAAMPLPPQIRPDLTDEPIRTVEEEIAAIRLSLADEAKLRPLGGYSYYLADQLGNRAHNHASMQIIRGNWPDLARFSAPYLATVERPARQQMGILMDALRFAEVLAVYQSRDLAWVLDQDGDDKLWSIHICLGWRRMLILEVHNSTPKADGTREVYYIPVDTALRPILPGGVVNIHPQEYTVRNAVASTFGLRGEDYNVESAA